MKSLLLILLIASLHAGPQVQREEPDLLVVKFVMVKDKQRSTMIRGAQNPTGSISTPITNDQDLGSRRADLRIMEKKAAGSAAQPPVYYHFRLEVKNTGTSIVRGLIWEFRPNDGPDDYQPKQYLCSLQVKPNENKTLDLWTPFLPMKVVSAQTSKDAQQDGAVVINQILYADGSVWKKSGWNYKLPADSLQKLGEGGCSVF